MIGYARAVRRGESLMAQRRRLAAAGARIVHEDLRGGGTAIRPALRLALADLNPGDVLCVTSLDRLARAPHDLFTLAADVEQRGAHLFSLNDGLDTRAPGSSFFEFAALMLRHHERAAEDRRQEREILDAPRSPGPQPAINDATWLTVAPLIASGELTPVQAADRLGVSRATVYRRMGRNR